MLPNGNLHGYQTIKYDPCLVGHTLYYNDVAIAALIDTDMDVSIFVCQCTKQVSEDYVYNKLQIPKEKMKEKGIRKYNCNKCNTGIERIMVPNN